nr:MAG TPA: hypothetical protein [Bacteriophage sp.]
MNGISRYVINTISLVYIYFVIIFYDSTKSC